MKISVRTDYLFEKQAIEDQIRYACDAGADAVEFGQMLNFDCTRAAAASAQCGIPFLACGFYDMWNCRLGDSFERIQGNLMKTIDCAKALGCHTLLGLVINSVDRGDREKARFVENMKPVVEILEKHNMVALIEPHNTILANPVFDFSHYFVNSIGLGNELVSRINSPSVRLLFDVYHEQIMTGNLSFNIQSNFESIAHYHLSGVPGRDEPENGEINCKNLLNYIESLGYTEYFGLEYFPSSDGRRSLTDTIAYLKNRPSTRPACIT